MAILSFFIFYLINEMGTIGEQVVPERRAIEVVPLPQRRSLVSIVHCDLVVVLLWISVLGLSFFLL